MDLWKEDIKQESLPFWNLLYQVTRVQHDQEAMAQVEAG